MRIIDSLAAALAIALPWSCSPEDSTQSAAVGSAWCQRQLQGHRAPYCASYPCQIYGLHEPWQPHSLAP